MRLFHQRAEAELCTTEAVARDSVYNDDDVCDWSIGCRGYD